MVSSFLPQKKHGYGYGLGPKPKNRARGGTTWLALMRLMSVGRESCLILIWWFQIRELAKLLIRFIDFAMIKCGDGGIWKVPLERRRRLLTVEVLYSFFFFARGTELPVARSD